MARSKVDVAVRDLHRAEGAQQSSSIATKLEVEIVSMQDEEIRGRLLALMSQLQGNSLNNIALLEQTVLEAKVSHLPVMCSHLFYILCIVLYSTSICAIGCYILLLYKSIPIFT